MAKTQVKMHAARMGRVSWALECSVCGALGLSRPEHIDHNLREHWLKEHA